MDVNATLARMRELARDIEQQDGKWAGLSWTRQDEEEATTYAQATIGEELATLVVALDEHLSRGGELPEEWWVW